MATPTRSQEPLPDGQASLVRAIKEYVRESPLNALKDIDGSPIYDEPLVGFADGDDPLFQQFKTVVSEHSLTPREALVAHVRETTGEEPPAWPHVGVVAWVLPLTQETRRSNAEMTDGPSRRWNHSRFQGEDLNETLRHHVVSLLQEAGCLAVAPVWTKHYAQHKEAVSSAWSERHAAYAAGLGTFGLSDGLITPVGIAHRCSSIVATASWVPTARAYTDHLSFCPYPHDGSCGACIARCPAGAISPAGHDKAKCHQYVMITLKDWAKRPGYIGTYGACGLCQTKVPCEARVPSRRKSGLATKARR
jgi:epoxyqueuosine reductase